VTALNAVRAQLPCQKHRVAFCSGSCSKCIYSSLSPLCFVQGICHDVAPADGGAGYTLRVDSVSLPLDRSTPPILPGTLLLSVQPHQSASATAGPDTASDPTTAGSGKSSGRNGHARKPNAPRKRTATGHFCPPKATNGGVPASRTGAAGKSPLQGASSPPQGSAQPRHARDKSAPPTEPQPTNDARGGLGTVTDGECLGDTGREPGGNANCGTPEEPRKHRVNQGARGASEGHKSLGDPDLPRQAAPRKGKVSVQSVALPKAGSGTGEDVTVDVIHSKGKAFCMAAQLSTHVLGLTPHRGWLKPFKDARYEDKSRGWRLMYVDELAAVNGKADFMSWGPQSTLIVDVTCLRPILSELKVHGRVISCLEKVQPKGQVRKVCQLTVPIVQQSSTHSPHCQILL
jgi:hypothetical protein